MSCKINRFLLFFTLVFGITAVLLRATLLAQEDDTTKIFRIGRIIVQGNEKTKRYVIVRELEFKSGDRVNREELESARKRIENLNIFNRVVFQIEDNGNSKDLIIMVWERWYLFPAPIFAINEHDWNKLSYGIGVFHSNFRGRAENLWFSGWLGYNPGLNFSYFNRWFGGKRRLTANIGLTIQKIASKTSLVPEVDLYKRALSVNIGKRFGIYWYTDIIFGLTLMNADEPRIRWQSRYEQDQIISLGFKIQKDTRDLWEYPRSGTNAFFAFSRYQLLNGSKGYNRWTAEWREYRTLWNITFAGRMAAELVQNEIPVYHHKYLGYEERIRGHFSEVYEGDDRLLNSLEIRIPVFRELFVDVPMDNWFSDYFKNMRLGMYITIFHDTGAVWYRSEKLHSRNWQSGNGFGLNFVLPYSNILRLEYAFDELGNGETIVDVNLSF